MTDNLASLAREALTFFQRGEREADGIGAILVTENPPDWVRDLCMAAHEHGAADGPMMPNDWRYEFIGEALDVIEDNPDDDDELHERFDAAFDTSYEMTHQRTAWLSSSNYRPGYVDEAKEEYGGNGADMMTSLWLGMRCEAAEVFQSVVSSLREQAEARE
jgi:hypothetical protein